MMFYDEHLGQSRSIFLPIRANLLCVRVVMSMPCAIRCVFLLFSFFSSLLLLLFSLSSPTD